jgi:adenylate cyclase class 2
MVEIELKARIDDPEGVKKGLSELGIYDCAYEKDDTYWFFAKNRGPAAGETPPPTLPPSGLRLRRETNTGTGGGVSKHHLVTYKTRELRAGMEVNDEREFEVSDGTVFEDLLRRLGLEPGIGKNKRGWAWILAGPAAGVRAELSDVKGLGWFLELEILAPEGDEQTIARCRERLFFFLDALKIPREKIEPRPYTEMLRALQ